MRRIEKMISDQTIILEILNKSDVCRLGMIDEDEVYIVPVNFAFSEGIIYIHSATEGKKINLLQKNNRVSFEMELESEILRHNDPCGWTTRYRSIMGTGYVTIETDPELKKKGLDLIMLKYGAKPPFHYHPTTLSNMVVLKLKIETLTAKQSGSW